MKDIPITLSSIRARKLLAVMLLTDGSLKFLRPKNYWRAEYYGNDRILHDIFCFLIKRTFGKKRTKYFFRYRLRTHHTIFVLSENEKKAMFDINPDYRTIGKSNIRFLFDEPLEIRQIAFRLAMSADGCITFIKPKNGKWYARLKLGCTNYNLLKEWEAFARDLGLDMRIERSNKTWSKYYAIVGSRKDTIRKFYSIGGFIKGVNIQRSKRFKGVRKNRLLKIATLDSNSIQKKIQGLVV